MLTLIVHHSPSLVAFVCGLPLRLSQPPWQHGVRLADALIVSEARHKTSAGLSRRIVDAPDASHGADSLRISPWTADDLRAAVRQWIVSALVPYARQPNPWPLSVRVEASLGAKDKGTRHLEAVEYPHDPSKSQGSKKPYYTKGTGHVEGRVALGTQSYAYEGRRYLRAKTVRRLNRQRPPAQRLPVRKKTTLAQEMLAELPHLLPTGFHVDVLWESW